MVKRELSPSHIWSNPLILGNQYWRINTQLFYKNCKNSKCKNILKYFQDHQITITIDSASSIDFGNPLFYSWDPRCNKPSSYSQMILHKNSTTFQLIHFSKNISMKIFSLNFGRFTTPLCLPDNKIVVVTKSQQSKNKLLVVLDNQATTSFENSKCLFWEYCFSK